MKYAYDTSWDVFVVYLFHYLHSHLTGDGGRKDETRISQKRIYHNLFIWTEIKQGTFCMAQFLLLNCIAQKQEISLVVSKILNWY